MLSLLSLGRAKEGAKRSGTDLAMRQVLAVKPRRRLPTARQWMQLPRFLSPFERRLAALAMLFVLGGGAALGYQFVTTYAEQVPAVGGQYTEGLIGYPHYINPLYASASDVDAGLARLVYSGLMRFDPQEGLVPDLAEAFTISEDEKVYTFTLREGLLWHDNEPVTSEDVFLTVSLMQNPDYRSPLSAAFSGIAVETLDTRTVQFTLTEPYAPFLSTMTVGVLPAHIWQNVSPANAQYTQLNLKPIGSGPYRFAKLTKDNDGNLRSMSFVRNEHYHRGAPFIEQLNFKFFLEEERLVQALRNKNIEGASILPYQDVNSFIDERSLTLQRPSLRQYTGAFFNLKSTGAVADTKVRQALAAATDRHTLITTVHAGNAMAVATPLISGMPGYDPGATIPTVDTAAAATLLTEAGWTIPEGSSVRTKGDKTLTIPITVLDRPELVAVAEELRHQWETVGVAVNVLPVSPLALQNEVLKGRTFDVLVTGELYSLFPDPYPFWHSSQVPYPGLNISQLVSKEVDDAISTIRSTADQTARTEAFSKFEDGVMTNTPAIFLYQPTYPYALPNTIRNVDLPAIVTPADRFADVHEWYMRMKPVFKASP